MREPFSSQPDKSVYQLTDEAVEYALYSGENAGQMIELFGEAEWEELRALAIQARSVRASSDHKVLILPGIMGSKLGANRSWWWDDLIWFDPVDAAVGNLTKLALPSNRKIEARGVFLIAYLKLKLTLKSQGLNAEFYPYDWRQDLGDLGRELVAAIRVDRSKTITLVAHSMGGLVARAAMNSTAAAIQKVSKLIMLGTPNNGSFSPAQVYALQHGTFAKLAALDQRHDVAELTRKLGATLPGLCQMLPFPQVYDRHDLYKHNSWSNPAIAPSQALLTRARQTQAKLAIEPARMLLIAGVNQATVVDMEIAADGIQFFKSNDGDGTVPLAFAKLDNVNTWYVEEEHGALPNNRKVREAVCELIAADQTAVLPTTPPVSRGPSRAPLEFDVNDFADATLDSMTARERRRLLRDFVAPAQDSEVVQVTVAPDKTDFSEGRIVVSRQSQKSLEIVVSTGSIVDVRARAIVLGMFNNVNPAGAAGAIDERLDGALAEFIHRRMFTAELGQAFAFPSGRHLLYAETVLFAGLGNFDTYNDDAQQFVAENIVRTLSRTQVDDFATVAMGTSTGISVRRSIRNFLTGCFNGLNALGPGEGIKRLVLCEYDAARAEQIFATIYELAGSELFDDIRVTLSREELQASAITARSRPGDGLSAAHSLLYLYVRQNDLYHTDPRDKENYGTLTGEVRIQTSVLTAGGKGGKGAVLTGERIVRKSALDTHLKRIEQNNFGYGSLPEFGRQLAELVLDESVTTALMGELEQYSLVIINDSEASRIPWETLRIGGKAPALLRGVTRRYLADNLSIAKWSEQRRIDNEMHVLLIVDPTGDLPGAEAEGEKVEHILEQQVANARVKVIRKSAATRLRILEELKSGDYDVLHYAGHAFFDPEHREQSGLICAGHEVLTGRDVASLSRLPALMVFNACESGRVRRPWSAPRSARADIPAKLDRNMGLAEAFLRGGVANYVGTYWPVGDLSAKVFGEAFYTSLASGASIGEALQLSRQQLDENESVDWADYIHYGSFDFRLKLVSP